MKTSEANAMAEERRALDDVAAFFDSVAAVYDTELPFFSSFAADLVAWSPITTGASVLDLCTGEGACLVPIGRSHPRRLVGLDVSPKMLLRASARCADANVPVELVLGDAHHLPFDTASFDAFYCALSWHFLARPEQVLSEIQRVGKDSATLVLSLLGASQHTWPFLGVARARYAPRSFLPPPRRGSETMEEILGRAGWLVVDTSSVCRQFEFDSPEHWLGWQWSNTTRVWFELVDEARRSELLDHLLTEAAVAHRRTGLRTAQTVQFIRASRGAK